MDKALGVLINQPVLSERDMTVATVRDDTYPQATTDCYVNESLKISFGCDAVSQVARYTAKSNNLYLTIDAANASSEEAMEPSIGGIAERVTNSDELARRRGRYRAPARNFEVFLNDGSYYSNET